VREYVPPSESGEMSTAQADQMRANLESKRAAMEMWCRTAYDQVSLHSCTFSFARLSQLTYVRA